MAQTVYVVVTNDSATTFIDVCVSREAAEKRIDGNSFFIVQETSLVGEENDANSYLNHPPLA